MMVVLGDREALAAATAHLFSSDLLFTFVGDSTADGNSDNQLEMPSKMANIHSQQQKKVKTVLLIWEKIPGGL